LQILLRQQLLQKQLLLPEAYRAAAGSLGCLPSSSNDIIQKQEQQVMQHQGQQQQLEPQQWQSGEILGDSSKAQQPGVAEQGVTMPCGACDGSATTARTSHDRHGVVLPITCPAAAGAGHKMDGFAAALVGSAVAAAGRDGEDVGQDVVCDDFRDYQELLAVMAAILE
jgi:hypothetical protein